MTVKIDYEIELEVTGAFIPLSRGRSHMDNGDPGYPDEGGCFEVESIYIGNVDVTKAFEHCKDELASLAYEDIMESL